MKDQPVLSFKTKELFNKWLKLNHSKSDGIWLRFFKKDSGKESINYQDALREALCYGWIDGQAKSYDDQSWIQRYTPRRKRSIWSKRNTVIVEELIKQKKMRRAGLVQINLAKEDGRWDEAYASQKDMKVPVEFVRAVKKNKTAYETFKGLSKSALYKISMQLHLAKKPETKDRKTKLFIEKLERKEEI